jgi:hypothetical protein
VSAIICVSSLAFDACSTWAIIISVFGLFGIVVGILAYYARGRGFDFRTVQTFLCTNMSICIGFGCFYVCIYKRKCMYVLNRHLESITQAL